jgi:uncharacterized protein YfaS (alpha-2-macroglobulin family)/TolA-binding protein
MRRSSRRLALLLALACSAAALALAAPALAERVKIRLQIANLARSAKEALADRDYKSAARTLEELAKTGEGAPEGMEALLLLGKARLFQGDAPGALEAWDRFLRRYPDATYASKVRFLMADAYTAAKKFKDAAEVYRERAEFLTGEGYRAKLAALYLEIADQAFVGVKSGKEGDPLDPPKVTKDFARALAMYQKARTIGVEAARRAEVAHRIAVSFMELGNPTAAANEWTAFFPEFEPSKEAPEAALGLGRAFLQLGRAREAREMFARVEEKWADSKEAPLAVESLGVSWIEGAGGRDKEQVKRGLAHWARFLERYPQHADAPAVAFKSAAALLGTGDLAAAIAAFEAVVARFPKSDFAPEAQFAIGGAHLQGERYDEARAAWSKFLGTYPSHRRFVEAQRAIVAALFQKAQDLQTKKRLEAAEAAAREFLQQYPIDALSPRAQLLIAETLFVRGEVKRAREEYAVCASKYVQSVEAPKAQLRVAEIEEHELSDLPEAIAQYEALIARFPGSPQAGQAAETIRVMREKSLAAVTARAYASNEPLLLGLETRNIAALDLKAYKIDLLEYFRKKHRVGGVEELAIEIVAPDKAWKDAVDRYEPYRLFRREVALPLEGKGAFVVSCEEEQYRAVTLVLRSDIGIVVKEGPNSLVVFAKDEVTGRPAAGVHVLVADGGSIVGEGDTGADGVFQKAFDSAPGGVQVFAYRDKDYAYSQVTPAAATTWGYTTKAYIYTDRPVYRPGQDVHWRGILRKVADGTYQASAGEPLEVSVRDARGVVLTKKTLKTDDYGAFAGDLTLGDEPPLGTYTVAARYAGTDFSGSFEVEAYKKPEVLVDVEASGKEHLTGDEVKATARVSYYFGGAVKDAPVRWSLFLKPYVFDAERYKSFAWFFAKEERRTETAGARFLARGEARTDKDGKVEIPFETEPGEDDRLYTLQVEAQDPSRRWVAGATNVYVTAKAFFAVVELDKKVYRPGETVRVTARAVDAGHRGVAAKGEIVLFKRRASGEDPVRRVPLEVGEDGKADVPVKVDEPGEYRLAFVAKDRRGGEVAGGAPLTVAGEAVDLAKEAKLVVERAVYTRGDKASVLVNAPAAPCWALLTFEGEKVLDYRVVELKSRSTTLEIEMKDAYSPNVFIRVAIPADHKLYESQDEVAVLKFLKLAVKPDRASARPGEKITWTIESWDHAGKPVDAEVSLAVVDASIYAVKPDATPPIQPFFYDQKRTLAVATRSSYEWRYQGVTAMKARELLEELARREMDVRDAKERSDSGERYRLAREFEAAKSAVGGIAPMAPPASAPAPQPLVNAIDALKTKGESNDDADAPGGGGFADGRRARGARAANGHAAAADPAPVLRVRRTFADTAYWNPTVLTRGGKAVVETPLPDNLTTWRATVRGATKDTLVGSAEAEAQATQKVLVRLETPRFATQGDAFTMSTLVHNYAGEALRPECDLVVLGGPSPIALADGASTFAYAVNAAPGDVARKDVAAKATGQGVAHVRAKAATPVESDAVEMALPVLPWGVRERKSTSGSLEGGEMAWKFEVPDDAVQGTPRLVLRLTPSVATVVIDALGYLDAYPYGCVEQTVNRFLPAIAAHSAIDAAGVPAEDARRALEERVERGIVRLANLQRPDGGWGWWPEAPARAETTALALAGLELAREGGFFVDSGVLDRGRQAAANLVRAAGEDQDARAVLLFALSLSKRAPQEEIARAMRAVEKMSTGAAAELALACDEQGRREMAARAVETIVGRAKTADGRTSWDGGKGEGGAWFAGGVESTAWAVLALLRYDPQSALVEGGVKTILASRAGAAWRSTRETGAVVLALGAYVRERGVARNDYRIEVFLDGKSFATTEVKGGAVDEQKRTLAIGSESLAAGAHEVRIVKTGTGALHFALTAEAVRGVERIEPAGTLVKVTRKYVRYLPPVPEGESRLGKPGAATPGYTILEPAARPDWRQEDALREVLAGEKVLVRVAVEVREPLHYAILEDRLPAGLEPLEEGAAGPFERFEPRDDRVAFFASRLAPGTHVFSYVARAQTPGEFRALAAECSALYEPEVAGRSAGAMIVVKTGEVAPREPTPDEIAAEALRLVEAKDFAAARPLLRKLLAMRLLEEARERLLEELVRCEIALADAPAAVKSFEELRDRNPHRADAFTHEPAQGLGLARAFGAIGDHERALFFLRGLVAGQFRLDAEVADTYRSLGRELGAQDYLANLVRRYPDTDYAIDGWYAVARRYYDLDRPPSSSKPVVGATPRSKKMWDEAYAALKEFTAFHPESSWCDKAQYFAVLAIYNLEQYDLAALEAEKIPRRYPKSDLVDDALFYATLARFQEQKYDQALATGERLLAWREKRSDGQLYESEFVPQVRHIFAKIYHLRGDLQKAVEYYRQVANNFEDARDALAFFTAKEVHLDEVIAAPPGKVDAKLRWRNLAGAKWKLYPVDLLLLFMKEKDLRAIASVDLTGVAPRKELETRLSGREFEWNETSVRLPVEEKGAYLVVAKADDMDVSALLILTDLDVKVQRVGDKVRVYAASKKDGKPAADAYVTVSDGQRIVGRGRTDARGVFEARGAGGAVSVVAEKEGNYALYRE